MAESKNKKSSKVMDDLSRLLDDAGAAEKNITGKNPEPAKEKEKAQAASREEPFDYSSYEGFLEANPKFKNCKKETAILFDHNRDVLKKVAQAEDSHITTLINNICYSWILEHKSDIQNSLKKLSRGIEL